MTERPRFLEARDSHSPGDWVLLGAPLDVTTSYGKGTGQGPDALRRASDCLEDYCPVSDRSLLDRPFGDAGDVALDGLEFAAGLDAIGERVGGLLAGGARPFLLGGEHSVSLPAITAVFRQHPDLAVLQFDAHADLREAYEGEARSHACVMRRVLDFLPPGRIAQVGIRSGTREEWQYMREHGTLLDSTPASLASWVEGLNGAPLYVTVDLDVLDPSVLPGTGTPEPGGLTFLQLDALLRTLASARIVGADAVELSPPRDPSEVSAVTASKVVRTMLLCL